MFCGPASICSRVTAREVVGDLERAEALLAGVERAELLGRAALATDRATALPNAPSRRAAARSARRVPEVLKEGLLLIFPGRLSPRDGIGTVGTRVVDEHQELRDGLPGLQRAVPSAPLDERCSTLRRPSQHVHIAPTLRDGPVASAERGSVAPGGVRGEPLEERHDPVGTVDHDVGEVVQGVLLVGRRADQQRGQAVLGARVTASNASTSPRSSPTKTRRRRRAPPARSRTASPLCMPRRADLEHLPAGLEEQAVQLGGLAEPHLEPRERLLRVREPARVHGDRETLLLDVRVLGILGGEQVRGSSLAERREPLGRLGRRELGGSPRVPALVAVLPHDGEVRLRRSRSAIVVEVPEVDHLARGPAGDHRDRRTCRPARSARGASGWISADSGSATIGDRVPSKSRPTTTVARDGHQVVVPLLRAVAAEIHVGSANQPSAARAVTRAGAQE